MADLQKEAGSQAVRTMMDMVHQTMMEMVHHAILHVLVNRDDQTASG
jgi:hypothetical protein